MTHPLPPIDNLCEYPKCLKESGDYMFCGEHQDLANFILKIVMNNVSIHDLT